MRVMSSAALQAGEPALSVVIPLFNEEDNVAALTAEVAAAARLLDLEFLDHLVIGRGRWVSIRSQRPTIWATTAAPD